jgi:hypothetical protein
MAAGPLLTPAIEDLARLPPKAHERVVAEHILLDLQHALKQQPSRNPEEQEFIVTMGWLRSPQLAARGLRAGRMQRRAP